MNAATLRQELAAQHVALSISDAGKLKYEAPAPLPAALAEAMKQHKAELLAELSRDPETSRNVVKCGHAAPTPALPSRVASMVSAAASGQITGSAHLPSGLVTDLGVYVLAWAAAYLTGDQAHALARLTEAQEAWNRGTR